MKTISKIIVLTTTLMMISCLQVQDKSDKDQFTGLWKLHILEFKDPVSGKYKMYKDGLQGYILYDGKDNMAVHLTSRGYQNPDIAFHDILDSASIEELRHRSQSYVYFAKYKVLEDEKKVEHARISHSNPNEWNLTVQRWYEFKGDTLVLITVENTNSPLRVKWIKYLP